MASRLGRHVMAGLLALVLGCRAADQPPLALVDMGDRVVVSDGWLAMGTFFEADLRVRAGDRARARAWLEWARDEIVRLEAIYSRWQPESELSRLNRRLATAPAPTSLPVGEELAELLAEAFELTRASAGAFDVTVGPLVSLWWEAERRDRLPSPHALAAAARRVGARRVATARAAALQVEVTGVELDLDGLSKGAVLDRLGLGLERSLPTAAALLSFGQSSVLAIGDPDGRGWRLSARSRRPDGVELARLVLRDRALSISSGLGRTIEIEGRRFSHVIDPRSGRPVREGVEAIVVGPRAARADAWSTALLVLGADPAEARSGLRALARQGFDARVLGDGRALGTPGWSSWLEGALGADGAQSASRSAASAHSRRASSLQEQALPVPPQEPLSSRPESTTPTAMAAIARQKIVAVARKVVIEHSGAGRQDAAPARGH